MPEGSVNKASRDLFLFLFFNPNPPKLTADALVGDVAPSSVSLSSEAVETTRFRVGVPGGVRSELLAAKVFHTG